MRSRFKPSVFAALWASLALTLSPGPCQAQIDPRADELLQAMGSLLAGADQFSFRAHASYDTFTAWGQEIQQGGIAEIRLRRPDGLEVTYLGDNRQSRVLFNGETLVFHDLLTNLFAAMVPDGGIDAAIDELFDRSGTSVPIADLLYADPYRELIESSESGTVIGQTSIDGMLTHQLAFSAGAVDWQIWIDAGSRPVPRRLTITYKEMPGAPQYVARLVDWDFDPGLAKHDFDFSPAAGAQEMEFLRVKRYQPIDGVQP